MKTNEKVEQGYEVDTLKPLSQCSVDELEYATEDGCWVYYGWAYGPSEDEVLRSVAEEMGRKTRIHQEIA